MLKTIEKRVGELFRNLKTQANSLNEESDKALDLIRKGQLLAFSLFYHLEKFTECLPRLSDKNRRAMVAGFIGTTLSLAGCGPAPAREQLPTPIIITQPASQDSGRPQVIISPTNPEPSPQPSPTPILKKAELSVGQVLAIGGAEGEIRRVKGEVLAERLGGIAKDWTIYTNEKGEIEWQVSRGENNVLHYLLPYAPEGFEWRDEQDKQYWLSSDGRQVFIPDVLLLGGWIGDEKTGYAGPTIDAEAIFLVLEQNSQYRLGILYNPEKIKQLGIEPKQFLLDKKSESRAFDLPDESVVYLSDVKTEDLGEGERIERDEDGNLIKYFNDGSYYKRITSWGGVRSYNEVHQAGAFAGPIDMNLFKELIDPSISPVPYAPESIVPKNWQEKSYRYVFDPKTKKVFLYQGESNVIAKASYKEGRWEWERAGLRLTPTVLSLEQARNFIAGGEYLTEKDLKQFEGRVYALQPENVSGPSSDPYEPDNQPAKGRVTLLLSQKALAYLQENQISLEESDWIKMVQEAMNEPYLKKFFNPKEPFFLIEPKKQMVPTDKGEMEMDIPSARVVQKPPIFLSIEDGKQLIYFVVDENDALNSYTKVFYVPVIVGSINDGQVVFTREKFDNDFDKAYNAIFYSNARFSDKNSRFSFDDSYQITHILAPNRQGKLIWQPILLHQRKDGEYELLTPEQRIRAILKEYGSKYGLVNPDGSPKPKAFKILYNSRNEPVVLLLVQGKDGTSEQFGLDPALNIPQTFEKAWKRLGEIDPDIYDILTNVYGLKIIGGDLGIGELFFCCGRGYYLATYTHDSIAINESVTDYLSPPERYSISDAIVTILMETRAIAHDLGWLIDSNDPQAPYWARVLYGDSKTDKGNPGVDKANFVLEWIKKHRSKLTKEEYEIIKGQAEFVREWYRKNFKR